MVQDNSAVVLELGVQGVASKKWQGYLAAPRSWAQGETAQTWEEPNEG
jgi:hypothetical protein